MNIQLLPHVREPTYRAATAASETCALALAFMVGTGGVSDASYFQHRHEHGYAIAGIHSTIGESPAAPRTPAKDLARVREVFQPAISDLAAMLHVSRQAIYNWLNGEQPKADFAARLDDLARAADIIAAENFANLGQALRRKIADGKSLIEVVASGGSARDAALNLALVLRREMVERKQLDAKLANRERRSSQIDDFGSPMLNENM